MKASSRQVRPPRTSDHTKDFPKDWSRLKEAMLLLVADGAPLGPEWRDHALHGEWAGFRKCHVGGDFLLTYRADETAVVFVRAGTHADLFR